MKRSELGGGGRGGGRKWEPWMDGHKTPSKDNKERQHGKVRRHMGPRERDGRGCMAAG